MCRFIKQRQKEYIKKSKKQTNSSIGNIIQNKKQQKLEKNRNGEKNLQIFQRTNWWDCTRKHGHGYEREISKETESLLIAAQSNTIRTNYVKDNIDNTQKNSKSSLCEERDEMVNHMLIFFMY